MMTGRAMVLAGVLGVMVASHPTLGASSNSPGRGDQTMGREREDRGRMASDEQIEQMRASMTTPEGEKLEAEAIKAIRARWSSKDLVKLGQDLQHESYLKRLDSAEAYQGTTASLRLTNVMKALKERRSSVSEKVLVDLIDSKEFQKDVLRMMLLIEALSSVPSPSSSVIAYWNRLSEPESPIASNVIQALLENGSPAALELFERKILDARFNDRLYWLREYVLPLRSQPSVILESERLFKNVAFKDFRSELLDLLFDFKPEVWFANSYQRGHSEEYPKPPAVSDYSSSAKKELRRVGNDLLSEGWPSEAQKKKIKEMLAQL